MASYFKKRKTWAVSYRLKGGARQWIYGIQSEKVARQTKIAKDVEEQLVKTGLHIPRPNAAKIDAAELKAIEQHIDDFGKSIVQRGKKTLHAQQTAAHVRRLVKTAGFTRISQLDGEPLQAAAKKLIDDGLSPRTANAGVKAMRQFSTWLYTSKRVAIDVLHRRLHTFNEALDQRRLRRALSIEELSFLLDAARAGRERCGIRGADREILYQVAVGTGFRQAACLSLTKSSFHVEPKLAHPFVRLEAKFNKNRKERDQRIRRDLADLLHEWLKGQPGEGRLWRTPKHAHLELMVRRDLEVARAAWVTAAAENATEKERRERSSFLLYLDHSGRYVDFHGLRHTGISLVVRSAGLRAGQVWADHSSPLLTAKYAHMDVTDEEKALDGLPAAHSPGPSPLAGKTGKNQQDQGSRKIG